MVFSPTYFKSGFLVICQVKNVGHAFITCSLIFYPYTQEDSFRHTQRVKRAHLPCRVVKVIIGERSSVNWVIASFLVHNAPPAAHSRKGFGEDRRSEDRPGNSHLYWLQGRRQSLNQFSLPLPALLLLWRE